MNKIATLTAENKRLRELNRRLKWQRKEVLLILEKISLQSPSKNVKNAIALLKEENAVHNTFK